MRTGPTKLRLLLAFALAVAMALTVAACGGSDDSTSSGGSTSGSTESTDSSEGAPSAALEEAQQEVDAHIEPPESIGPTVPISTPIPGGKTLAFIDCGVPICHVYGESLAEAAAVLGWKVKVIPIEPTPQGIQKGFEEAIRLKPDGVASTGFSSYQYSRQLKELNELEIPVFSATGTDESTFNPAEGITLQLHSAKSAAPAFELLGNKTAIDVESDAEVGTILITGFPISKIQQESYEEALERGCPSCTIKLLEVSPESIGKDSGQIITNFLRANPEIHSIYLSYDGLGSGLGTALGNAGVDVPKIYTWAPEGGGMERVRSGESTAAVPYGYREVMWQFVDGFARVFTGENVEDAAEQQEFVLWSEPDYQNVPAEPEDPPVVVDYQDQFKELWGK